MARITVAGGPSDARAQPGEVGYIEPADAAASGLVELTPPAPDYGSMTQADLRTAARLRGLSAAGSKAELVARLTEHDAGGDGAG